MMVHIECLHGYGGGVIGRGKQAVGEAGSAAALQNDIVEDIEVR